MLKTQPFDTLIELAQGKTDEATRRLGELQGALSNAAGMLDMLLQYRQDYLDQFNAQMRDGVSSAAVRNFQKFIDTLDGAIEQQRALTQQADTRLSTGRGEWRHHKQRLTSFDALAERARQREALTINKKEQRDNDERSARQFSLRSVALTE